jgi:hypothetical protein
VRACMKGVGLTRSETNAPLLLCSRTRTQGGRMARYWLLSTERELHDMK